jgi:hypothetical protein
MIVAVVAIKKTEEQGNCEQRRLKCRGKKIGETIVQRNRENMRRAGQKWKRR